MSRRLCPLCFRPTSRYMPFCIDCYKLYSEELKQALKDRPEWLKYIQANASVESNRIDKEREQGQIIND